MSRFPAPGERLASGRRGEPSAAGEWLSLGAASRLLGVAPGTLRRWSDARRVKTFVTPGGHRRFQRPTLERLLPADRPRRPALARNGVTPARLAHAYRREASVVGRESAWLPRLTDAQRDTFRHSGRAIARALLAYLDADGVAAERHQLAEASAEAAGHGRMTAGLGLSLGEAVEAFLQFRRPFLVELAAAGRRRGLDAAETADLLQKAERAMDHLLVATMTAHTVALVPEPPAAPSPWQTDPAAARSATPRSATPRSATPRSATPRSAADPASALAGDVPNVRPARPIR